MIVAVDRVRARRGERKVARALRVVAAEHPLGGRRQLVLELAGRRFAHRLHDPEPRDARHLAHERDLARALDEAHGVEDRVEVLDLDRRRRSFSFCVNAVSREGRPSQGSPLVARACAVASPPEPPPRTSARRGVKSTRPAWPICGDRGRERLARDDRLDPRDPRRLVSGTKLRPVVALAARRPEVERRALRFPVDEQDGARHLDAGQVEELVVLPEGDLRRHLRAALNHRDRVADLRHHPRAACGELLDRKDVGEIRCRLLSRDAPIRSRRSATASRLMLLTIRPTVLLLSRPGLRRGRSPEETKATGSTRKDRSER